MLATRWTQLKTSWLRLPAAVRWGGSLFVLARGLLWVWGWLLVTFIPYAPPTQLFDGPLSSALEPLILPWLRHDALWFTRIALEGYAVPDGRGAFSPLYPLLIQWGGVGLNGQYSVAAFIIANLGCLVSLILLYEIAQREFQVGRRALLALLLYPFAFFLFVPYNESLQLVLTLVVFWSARAGRWWLVGISGALAVLTKITALAMLPALALDVWLNRKQRPLRQGIWLILLPLAAVGWVLIRQWVLNVNEMNLGTAVLSPDFQSGWNEEVVAPWTGLILAVLAPFRLWPSSYTTMAVINLLMIGLVVYLTLLTVKLPRRSWAVYAVTMLTINLMLVVRLVPLLDVPRRMLTAFPIFIAAALYWSPRGQRFVVAGALLFQLTLSALFVKWVLIG
ncbi:MAG TPA: glycosyltransferase family 39 protein [Anaerolineae bacterium]|nr:glycosyltransferase family 39 protein [Anaerolineae bacterium]